MLSDIYDVYAKGKEYANHATEHINWQANDRVLFLGKNGEHTVIQEDGKWVCDCQTFKKWQAHPVYQNFCQHIVALETVLKVTRDNNSLLIELGVVNKITNSLSDIHTHLLTVS